jgi:para-nitrobenzyl esterase
VDVATKGDGVELTVKTTAGLVRGSEAAHGTYAFKGIPFAAAPVGPLRFRPPERPEAWDGTRDATRYGDVVPQVHTPAELGNLFDSKGAQGPDCLNLNVWTPDAGAVGLPVLVWIHGGAFVIGSGSDSLYDGSTFARDGIVCVTINYRLGAAGFHHAGDVPGSGCFGILDQIAALEWVQENIASFGGDPNRVTVAGESAGGMSVGCLLGAPAAKGLFRRAIPQSGAASHGMPEPSAALIARELVAKLGVDPADSTDEQLVAAQAEVAREIQETRDASRFGTEAATTGMGWSPMWGADVLPQPAIDAIRAGSAKDVDILIGTTRHEFLLFLGIAPQLFPVNEAMLPMLFDLAFEGNGAAALGRYHANRPGAPVIEIVSALQTDSMFRIPAIRLADAQVSNGAKAFFYRFDWESPAFDGRIRAGHALELPFTWDNLADVVGVGLTGGQGPQELADEMHAAWVRFITEGDPGWAPYDTSTRTTRVFGGAEEVLSDPDGDERLLWDGV